MDSAEQFVKEHKFRKPRFSDLVAGIDGEGKIRIDNTERLQEWCEINKNAINKMLQTPSGNEHQLFNVGDNLEFTEFGMYREGTPVPEIVEVYVENGYFRYVDAKGFVHRTKDIRQAV